MSERNPPTKSQTYGLPKIFVLALNKFIKLEFIKSKSKLIKKTTKQQLIIERKLIEVLSSLCESYTLPDNMICNLTANLFKKDIKKLKILMIKKKSFISLSELVRLSLRDFFQELTKLDLERFRCLIKNSKKGSSKKGKKKYRQNTTILEITKNKSMGIPYLFFYALLELKEYGIIESKSEVIRKSVHKYLKKEKKLIKILDLLTDNFECDEIDNKFLKPCSFNLFCKDIDEIESIIEEFKISHSKSELIRVGFRNFLFSLMNSGFMNIYFPENAEVNEAINGKDENIILIPVEKETEEGTKIIYEKRRILRKA